MIPLKITLWGFKKIIEFKYLYIISNYKTNKSLNMTNNITDPFEKCKAEIEYFKYIENLQVKEFYTIEELYTFKEFKWGNPSSKSKDNHGDYVIYIYNISIKEMYKKLYYYNLSKDKKYISYMQFLHQVVSKK